MEVIILNTGELKNVAKGYARNFLIPRKLAKPATATARKEAEAIHQRMAAEQATKAKAYQAWAKQLQATTLEFVAKTNASGTLFAALHVNDIADELTKRNMVVPKDCIAMQPIKRIGQYNVVVNLPECDTISISVIVKPMEK